MKIGLQLFINRLRVLPIKPQRQFFSLIRCQSAYRPFYVLQATIHAILLAPCAQLLFRIGVSDTARSPSRSGVRSMSFA